jgi:hypothetical protein
MWHPADDEQKDAIDVFLLPGLGCANVLQP